MTQIRFRTEISQNRLKVIDQARLESFIFEQELRLAAFSFRIRLAGNLCQTFVAPGIVADVESHKNSREIIQNVGQKL